MPGRGRGRGHGRGKPGEVELVGELSVIGSVSGLIEDGDSLIALGGENYTVVGNDFAHNVTLWISLANPGCCVGFPANTDGIGSFSFTWPTGQPGTYVVKVYAYPTVGNGDSLNEISFVVV